jgi:hypothetical protein
MCINIKTPELTYDIPHTPVLVTNYQKLNLHHITISKDITKYICMGSEVLMAVKIQIAVS